MAIFKKTAANSVITSSAAAFNSDTPLTADTLIVDPGASLISTNPLFHAVDLANTGAWTVTIGGTVFGVGSTGIVLASGNAATSTITVTADGDVGGTDAIFADSAAVITNAGVIGGTNNGIILGGGSSHTVNNTGIIFGTTAASIDGGAASKVSVTNSGELDGTVILSIGDDTLTNSGTLTGNVFASNGNNTLNNTGTITGVIDAGTGNDKITNTKVIGAQILLGDGTNILTNSGSVGSDGFNVSVTGQDGSDTISNSATGTLQGGVIAGNGANTLSNSGSIGQIHLAANAFVDLASYAGGLDADTVTNTGALASLAGWVNLGDGNNKLTNSGSIGIDANHASVSGGGGSDTISNLKLLAGGVSLGNGVNTLTNSGSIGAITSIDPSSAFASYVGGGDADTVTNNTPGQLFGWVNLGDGANSLTNSGSIGDDGAGISVLGGIGIDTINNSGTISAGIDLGAGNDKLTNSKVIGGTVNLGTGLNTLVNSGLGMIGGGILGGNIATDTDTVTNSGTVMNGVDLLGGINVLNNSGTIGTSGGGVSYMGGAQADTITNTKSILGDVILGDGVNKLTNSGTITHSVSGGAVVDTIINSGKLGDVLLGGPAVALGDGNDTFTDFVTASVLIGGVLTPVTTNGTIVGTVDLGNGDDIFNGGANAEIVKDGNGADIIKLGGGNDKYFALGATVTDGADTIDGGTGVDTYDATGSVAAVSINLDIVSHTDGAAVAANTARGADVSNALTDAITNFENATGGNVADIIFGSAAANTLTGNGGNDHLWGFDGNDLLYGGVGFDVLNGGAGNDTLDGGADDDQLNGGAGNDTLIGGIGLDTLVGGAGQDFLTGGDGADTFKFLATSDSGVSGTTRDVIFDFVQGIDKIDLLAIDAKIINGAGDDAFTFIGNNVAFGGVAGELRAYYNAFGQIIEGDVNGDKIADFSIAIKDPLHLITLNAGDFIL